MADKLHTTSDKGICTEDFKERVQFYGSNRRDPPQRTPFCKLFFGALEDFMLRILLVCAIISISFDMGFASHDELKTGTIQILLLYIFIVINIISLD